MVRDLLPLYLSKKTHPYSDELIKQHLENCEECAALARSMEEFTTDIPYFFEEEKKEEKRIDGLKKVKTRIKTLEVFIALGLVLLMLMLLWNIFRLRAM